jgi:large subunit ribosomal protein L19
MDSPAQLIEASFKKKAVVDVRPGDTVRVHQKIKEGGKERVQIFEGLVIRTSRANSLTSMIVVRRVASGVGVEKSYMLHSPSILKVEVIKRSKVRRNYLTYMRERTGKSARLTGMEFDKEAVNAVAEEEAAEEEAKIHEAALASHDEDAAKKAEEEAKEEAKAEAAIAKHDAAAKSDADKIEEQPKEKADAKAPAEPQNKDK